MIRRTRGEPGARSATPFRGHRCLRALACIDRSSSDLGKRRGSRCPLGDRRRPQLLCWPHVRALAGIYNQDQPTRVYRIRCYPDRTGRDGSTLPAALHGGRAGYSRRCGWSWARCGCAVVASATAHLICSSSYAIEAEIVRRDPTDDARLVGAIDRKPECETTAVKRVTERGSACDPLGWFVARRRSTPRIKVPGAHGSLGRPGRGPVAGTTPHPRRGRPFKKA